MKMAKSKDISKNKHKERAEVWIRKEVYGKAPEEHHFILANGERLKDLKELNSALEKMPDDLFKSHVNCIKNDFSTWVKDIFKEDFLANELKKSSTRIEQQFMLQKHINSKMEKIINKLAK